MLRETIDSQNFIWRCRTRPPADRGLPQHLLVAGQADNLYLIWDDGHLLRYDIRDLDQPRLAEQFDLFPSRINPITAVQFLPGKTTLAIGDTSGPRASLVSHQAAEARTVDGTTLVAAHELPGPWPPSLRWPRRATRLLAGRGLCRWQFAASSTSPAAARWSTCPPSGDQPLRLVAFAPKGDAIFGIEASVATAVAIWRQDFPRCRWRRCFSSVWYEGYDGPRHVWQSSGGGDDFEPKLGMMPLVFGTLKATVYSLLFAVPLALLVRDLQQRVSARRAPRRASSRRSK